MRVTFGTTGELRHYLTASKQSVEVALPPGATVADLLAQLGARHADLGVIAVNGETATPRTELHDGDHVDLIVPLGGG